MIYNMDGFTKLDHNALIKETLNLLKIEDIFD